MKTTKKPMMAKRATKAAPAKKKMMTSAKKPMTVAGKKVKKYQVGGPATTATTPAGMQPRQMRQMGTTATTFVPPSVTIPAGMQPRQMQPRGVGGVQPPRFTNYGPGSGQFQNPMPGMPRQGMVSNNGGPMTGQSPNYAQASELLSRMDPRSPFYGAIQQRLQQMGGMQSNNGAGMIANNPGALTGGMNQNDRARQQLMQQGMTPQQIQAQEAAIRQEMLRRGMPLGQGVGLPVGPRQGMGAPPASPRMTPQQLQQLQQQMAQSARGLGMGLPGGSQQQMPPMGQGLQGLTPQQIQGLQQGLEQGLQDGYRQQLMQQARQDAYRQQMMQQGMDPQRIQAEMARTTGVIGTPAPRQAAGFRKGGAVAKKKAAATTRGRMAKPARKR